MKLRESGESGADRVTERYTDIKRFLPTLTARSDANY